ncbi:kinetochore protein Nnf1 [Schizosaccharomyces cryophilus OY26]|uniref:Kinetochore-associated protein n=1 Tax=Schizosaccharomyces cryophilus (strain OY26 / ATCC MYA-4695 / CBS 11777 / NBRC 106824 / NRRL Y48691) TaxID=653667 RepID=S9X4D9_SCHCR|nr:kinetochore protein Nnf1 [Schizosaccharomyces cryophilus OY26]EPY51932.1 kinetochore protein Nnf1 [Schizosaccharomyces cryophilus OY26]
MTRKEQLEASLRRTLSETVAHIPLEKFAQCFPTFKKGKAIAAMHQQLISFFEETCKQEYAKLIEERGLHQKLDFLDQCIKEAKDRKGSGEPPIDIESKQPQEILKAHLYTHKQNLKRKLKEDIEDLELENQTLSQKIEADEEKTQEYVHIAQQLLQQLETTVKNMDERGISKNVLTNLDSLLSFIYQKEEPHVGGDKFTT